MQKSTFLPHRWIGEVNELMLFLFSFWRRDCCVLDWLLGEQISVEHGNETVGVMVCFWKSLRLLLFKRVVCLSCFLYIASNSNRVGFRTGFYDLFVDELWVVCCVCEVSLSFSREFLTWKRYATDFWVWMGYFKCL